MSTKYMVALCDTNARMNGILENFLDSLQKFSCLDILGGSRMHANYLKSYLKTIDDISSIKSRYLDNYNLYVISSFIEGPTDIPKNNAYQQNMAETDGTVVVASGSIKNIPAIARTFQFDPGVTLQEFVLNFYRCVVERSPKEVTQIMTREIETECLSFIIFSKKLNEMYVYNRGGDIFINSIPGMSLVISTEILPINNDFPGYGFRRLPSNCSLKVDTKTMFVQYVPIYSNTFSSGKDLIIDSGRALLYTTAADMEYFAAINVLTDPNVSSIIDFQTVFFGFSEDIDTIIFDKIVKLKKSVELKGKLPMHVKYDFANLYETMSDKLEFDAEDSENIKPKKKAPKKSITIRDVSVFDSQRLNFEASSLVSLALQKGTGNIIIPNVNGHNNRLISLVRSMISHQVSTPIYVLTMFDTVNLMEIIHYCINCKNLLNPNEVLIHCDRPSLSLSVSADNKVELSYNADSQFNYDTSIAFQKCGMENPFEKMYAEGNGPKGGVKIGAESSFIPDKLFTPEKKIELLDTVAKLTKNGFANQRKLLAFC